MTGPETPRESAAAPAGGAARREITHGALLGGRIAFSQFRDGYRTGMDAGLLAAAVAARPGERVFEAGCGAGGVLLQITARRSGVSLTGMERDAESAALARANIAENSQSDRIQVIEGDIADRAVTTALPASDWAVSNPPFFDDPGRLRAPSEAKRGAWIADDGLSAWIACLLRAVRDGGRVVVIHRADRLADLLALLGERAGSMAIRPIQPFADAPAKRVLVRAVKGGRGPLTLLPPLTLHDRSGGRHTVEAEAILRGEAELGWD